MVAGLRPRLSFFKTFLVGSLLYFPAMPPLLDSIFDRDEAHWPPEQETLELAAQGAAKVLGADHGVTTAFAKAAETMDAVSIYGGHGSRFGRCVRARARPSPRRWKAEPRSGRAFFGSASV